ESIWSVLQASGARPFTFWASAISTDQPACSRVSWTILAPVIDSITAQTGWRWVSEIRRAKLLQRVDVWGDGELVEVLPVIAQKADVEALSAEIQSGVQHVGGPPWCS
ncbi:MAG: hypothetical protein WA696_09570, partial [Solirubrobacterales bacterium]